MDDVIKVSQLLFDKWIELCKPIGSKLFDYFSSKEVEPRDLFSKVY